METLMFVDGVYPDFSLLKEVLLPPYLESEPSKTAGDPHSNKAITQCAQPQYRDQALGAAAALNESAHAMDSAVQYHRRSGRGRRRGGAGKRRSQTSVNFDNWWPPRNVSKNSSKIGQKMSCVTEISQPSIILLLEESMKTLPKMESNLEDEKVFKNGCSTKEDHFRTPSVNGYRMTECPSSMTGNPMEILNLINMKCSHLNKDLDYRWRNVGGGPPKTVKDLRPLASAKAPLKVQDSKLRSPIENGGLLSKDRNSSTSSGVSSVDGGGDQSGDSSLLNTSTEYAACVRKTPRKQRTPMKGVEKQDPLFQGVEFQMHLCFEKEKCDECQLIMTSCYSCRRSKRKRTKSRLRFKSTSLSSGSEDDQMHVSSSKSKRCASCKTQKTPLWRDAEDGTPLCNACGIRYKKYGLRCGQCWNIPKKDGKSCSRYCACGGMFRAPF
ncbi:GATA-type zinc finger protein 1 isoform X1 [Engystomops pustulosus]|uniref:GATA-type zinc finger protein 1 isoform X1 n=1 Tax=Engystomops pustulosus TaxID=76066 RepID=UPI003AFA32B7